MTDSLARIMDDLFFYTEKLKLFFFLNKETGGSSDETGRQKEGDRDVINSLNR